jgi:lactoylglutathione lyase
MFTQLAHIALHVKDLERSLDFYCRQLGLEEAFRLDKEDGSPWIVYIKLGNGSFLELFPVTDVAPSQGSFSHFCLSVDDLCATLEELRDKGMNLQGDPHLGQDGNWQYWLSDPDGNAIELMQIMPDSPQAIAYLSDLPAY